MLTMQPSGEIFPDRFQDHQVGMSLVGIKKPAEGQYDWSMMRNKPSGNDILEQEKQARSPGRVGGARPQWGFVAWASTGKFSTGYIIVQNF